jgi:hypothetical protein
MENLVKEWTLDLWINVGMLGAHFFGVIIMSAQSTQHLNEHHCSNKDTEVKVHCGNVRGSVAFAWFGMLCTMVSCWFVFRTKVMNLTNPCCFGDDIQLKEDFSTNSGSSDAKRRGGGNHSGGSERTAVDNGSSDSDDSD